MAKSKKEIRNDLVVKAREILIEKGLSYLTARKLSDYSEYSVGTIYNQFKSMDNLVILENCQTLDELYIELNNVEMTSDVYANLNRILEKFIDFVLNNNNLWFTLYNTHFQNDIDRYDGEYLRRIVKIMKFLERKLKKLFVKVPAKERKVSGEVLFITVFTLSSLLTKDKEIIRLDKKYVLRVLFNTYLAGMSYLAVK